MASASTLLIVMTRFADMTRNCSTASGGAFVRGPTVFRIALRRGTIGILGEARTSPMTVTSGSFFGEGMNLFASPFCIVCWGVVVVWNLRNSWKATPEYTITVSTLCFSTKLIGAGPKQTGGVWGFTGGCARRFTVGVRRTGTPFPSKSTSNPPPGARVCTRSPLAFRRSASAR